MFRLLLLLAPVASAAAESVRTHLFRAGPNMSGKLRLLSLVAVDALEAVGEGCARRNLFLCAFGVRRTA